MPLFMVFRLYDWPSIIRKYRWAAREAVPWRSDKLPGRVGMYYSGKSWRCSVNSGPTLQSHVHFNTVTEHLCYSFIIGSMIVSKWSRNSVCLGVKLEIVGSLSSSLRDEIGHVELRCHQNVRILYFYFFIYILYCTYLFLYMYRSGVGSVWELIYNSYIHAVKTGLGIWWFALRLGFQELILIVYRGRPVLSNFMPSYF